MSALQGAASDAVSGATLVGKRVLITGASSGMAQRIALDFAAQGAESLALVDINEAGLEHTAAALTAYDTRVSLHQLDLRSSDGIAEVTGAAAAHAGGLDTVINAAGVLDHQFTPPDRVAVDTLDEAVWDAVMDINLKASWLMIKAASPYLLASDRGPSIVNFASVAGMHGAGMTAYAISKAGLIQLTRIAAINLAPTVRVNAISPGSIRTPMSQAHLDAGEDRMARALSMYGTHLIPRMGETHEIASAAAFLASDAASFITGVNLPVDGGTTAWRGIQSEVPLDEPSGDE